MISVPPGPLVPHLDHGTLQLRQREVHRRAFGRQGANMLWHLFGKGGLGRVRLGGTHVGVARSVVGAVLGALLALRCGRGGPLRLATGSAVGPPMAGPARPRRGRSCGVISLSSGCGTMRSVCRRVRGPTRRRGSWGSSLGGGCGLTGRHRFVGRRFKVAGATWGCPAVGPTGTAASASRRSSCSAGVSFAHPGETGERERDRRWWRLSCVICGGKPSECDIAATLSRVPGCKRACPTISQCVSGELWVGPCGAGGGGGQGGSPGWSWARGHPPALGREVGKPFGPHAAPQLPVQGGA